MKKAHYFNKITMTLLIFLVITIPINAMTPQQAEGYVMEEATEKYLRSIAKRVVTSESEAAEVANYMSRFGKSYSEVLIVGGSSSNKYVPQAFGKVFKADLSATPDFIFINGKEVQIIESKRLGTYSDYQIKQLDELAKAIEKKGFKIKKYISCKSPCKLPKGWEKRISRSITKSGDLVFLEVAKYVDALMWLWLSVDVMILEKDREKQDTIQRCVTRDLCNGLPEFPRCWNAPTIPVKECMCISDDSMRRRCCEDAVWVWQQPLSGSQRDFPQVWNKIDPFSFVEFAQKYPLCRSESDYAYKKCLEFETGISSSNEAKEICSSLKPSYSTSSDCKPHYTKKCDTFRVYWYDSCGNKEEYIETCGALERCKEGKCVSITQSDSNESPTTENNPKKKCFLFFCR